MKLKAKSAIKINGDELVDPDEPKHIAVTYGSNGNIQALDCPYETTDKSLYSKAKPRYGVWYEAAGEWTFAEPAAAREFLDAITKKHPDWPIIGDPSNPFMPLAGIHISPVALESGFSACLVPFPLPPFARVSDCRKVHAFRVASGGRKNEEVGLLIGNSADITATVDSMTEQGAICDSTLATRWHFVTGSKLGIKVTGWAVQITYDLFNPFHYLAAPEQRFRWEGPYPYGIRVAVPWTGTVQITRKIWPGFRSKLEAIGIEWGGDDAEADLSVSVAFDAERVAGWNSPAPNGHLLHAYQKDGARFCASRGMRALIGDEMGVGKTVQAIAAAEAVDAPRILVVCPANARYVWDREIKGWGGRGTIQHITSQSDMLDMSARWHIVTYDLLVARAETWSLKDKQEHDAFVDAFPDQQEEVIKSERGYPYTVFLNKPLSKAPAFTDPRRVVAWDKMMRRLQGKLMEQILSSGQILVILDEAHRAKNKSSKRTKAIQRIATGERQLLMLTGTPLRNHEHEAATLLGLLDVEASIALSKERGYTLQDVKDYLNYFMIRRTKAEVLPQLPEKTRQTIDVSNLDPEQMSAYHAALDWAHETYAREIALGASEAQARQSTLPGIERARTALGIAKVRGGTVAELVQDVVQNKGSCVVFCVHHQASNELKAQLEKERLRVAIIDGRVLAKARDKIVSDFQNGRLDVVIGSINAAGEAITLTRADTAIFIELDWVPAALLQAEDRIHRVGQQNNCHIIHLIARMPDTDNLDEMMVELIGAKLARIGTVLNEDTRNIIDGGIQADLQNRLLGRKNLPIVQTTAANVQRTNASVPADADEPDVQKANAAPVDTVPAASEATVEKRKRGRPRVYVDEAPPTATERSKRSTKALVAAGGKRKMVRFTPEGHDALKIYMAQTGCTEETAAINQAIIAITHHLLNN